MLSGHSLQVHLKTPAQKYAEATENVSKGPKGAVASVHSASAASGRGVGDTISSESNVVDAVLHLNLEEADDLLKGKELAEQKSKEKKVRTFNDFSCAPCFRCLKESDGVLKGQRKSFPRKQHIVHYFKKTVNSRIDKHKQAVKMDGAPDLNLTYKDLDELSNAVAFNLKKSRFEGHFENHNPEGYLVIAVCLPVCYEYIVLIMAILKLGAAVLPISAEVPPERMSEIMAMTRPLLVITNSECDAVFENVQTVAELHMVYIAELWELIYSAAWFEKSILPFKSHIAGSGEIVFPPMWKRPVVISVIPSDTQDLQAVAFDSEALFNRMMWEDYMFVFITAEHCLLPPTIETADDLADIVARLCMGVTLVGVRSPIDYSVPDSLFMYIDKYKVRRLTLWPSLLKACIITLKLFEEFIALVSPIRFWFCVGGSVRGSLADSFFELPLHPLAQLVHMYHFEDCLGALAFQVFESGGSVRSVHARLPVGCPVPNTDIYLLSPDMLPVKDGQTGEIYIATVQAPEIPVINNLTNKYYMENPFTKKKERSLLIRTMDYGRILEKSNGTRFLVHETSRDRHYYIDNQTVWLLHLDMYIDRLSDLVKKFHTLCYRPHQDDQAIIAFCVLASEKISPAQVEEELNLYLPLKMIPEVVPMKEIPCMPATNTADENLLLKHYRDKRQKGQHFDGWDILNISDHHLMKAAKILTFVIFSFLGIPISELVTKWWTQPFMSLRRATVARGTFIVNELHRNRYPIYNDEFIFSDSLKAIPELMWDARRSRGFCNKNCPPDEVFFIKNRYKLEIMVEANRYTVCTVLAKSFTQRDQLDYYSEVSYSLMRKYFDSVWPMFVQKKLSLIIRRKKDSNKKLVGAVLTMNWHDEIQLSKSIVPVDIAYKLELIQYLESALTDSHFPQQKTHVLQICYIGLDGNSLTRFEIHGLTDKIIRSMLILGKVKGFEALVVITYDYFCYDICVSNYNFNVAKECQVNQFVASDGTRPYALCPDSMYATLCYKLLSKVEKAEAHKKQGNNWGPTVTHQIQGPYGRTLPEQSVPRHLSPTK